MNVTTQTPAMRGNCGTDRVAQRDAQSSVRLHAVMLGLSLAVILLSMTLTLGNEPGDVLLPFINLPLPTLCNLKRFTGLDCPGCGLTRSFIALGHGRLRDSIRFNPAGPLWFGLIAVQVPWHALQLNRVCRNLAPLESAWRGQAVLYIALAALIVQWVVRQFGWI